MRTTHRRAEVPVAPPAEGEPWTILHLLRWSTAYLTEKGVESARLDTEHLLARVMDADRLQLYLRFEQPVSQEELAAFRPLLLERARRKPLQYILGNACFRDLALAVDPRVLIPRPETEELVGGVLDYLSSEDGRGRSWRRALDIGTGSGAIALSLAHEAPFGRVVGSDVSAAALEVARANAVALGLLDRVEFRVGDGLEVVRPGERFDVLVSNPPYVTEGEFDGLAPEVRLWEPREALVAAEDGLSLMRRIVGGAAAVLEDGGLLALEVGAGQAATVARCIETEPGLGSPRILRDLAGRDRIVLAVREARTSPRPSANGG